MGYTHYYYLPKEMEQEKFDKLAADARKIFDYCTEELGIDLGDGWGEGKPVVDKNKIIFNGSVAQRTGVWTTNEQISIPWPSDIAGIAPEIADPSADKTDGHWFAGDLLTQRVAPINNATGKGSGNYETLAIERMNKHREWEADQDNPLVFDFCKTAYRPYDLTCTAVLIALKHYFPECKIKSDGNDKDWVDGKILCNNLLGYGITYSIDEGELKKQDG